MSSATPVQHPVLLQRVGDLRLHLDSSDIARATIDGRTIELGAGAMGILDAFARPTTIDDAVGRLAGSTTDAADIAGLRDRIEHLRASGVLVDVTDGSGPRRTDRGGFGSPKVHISMLNDRGRTTAFLDAIAEVVRPGQVVVEIGTGSGVLAIAAARAGARRVYAIEASGIASVAEQTFERNGVGDRITLLRGWSTRLDIPEPADVLVSELIGDDPLEEGVLAVTGDAVARMLRPGAALVPARIRIVGLPVTLPPDQLADRTAGPNLPDWSERYGVDFQPLADAAARSPYSFPVHPAAPRTWKHLAPPVALADVDLAAHPEGPGRWEADATIDVAGRCDGILIYFELALSDSVTYSTAPDRVADDCHWKSMVWLTPGLGDLRTGDTLRVIYAHDASGGSASARLERGVDTREVA